MKRRKPEQFEEALQRAARGEGVEGELASLVEVAHQATALAEAPPPPPQAPPARAPHYPHAHIAPCPEGST